MQNSLRHYIESIPLTSLKPWPRHARIHDAGKLGALIEAIRQNDLIDPIVVDEDATILSGHLRVAAYAHLGWATIPAIRISHLNAQQKRAYVIAANRFPERGGWDEELLSLEFAELVDFKCEIDLDTTGFETPEIDKILGHIAEPGQEAPIPDIPTDPISRLGDIWLLGDHRLYCGNSLTETAWKTVMEGELADLCFADAPYNVPIAGHVSSKGHAEFAMASGEMSRDQFTNFLFEAFSLAALFSRSGAIHYLCMDHRHIRELLSACDRIYSEQLNLCVWAKTNGGMGSMYRSQHELVGVFKVGSAPHINNVMLGKFGRNRSNVWCYAGTNTFRKGRDQDLADHPTVKPTALVADAILDASNPGDIVIDGFGGSGTLILAAEKTRRRARVIEIDPGYVDVAVRRWEEMTGRKAILKRSGSPEVIALPAPTTLFLPPPDKGGNA